MLGNKKKMSEMVEEAKGIKIQVKKDNLKEAQELSKYVGKSLAGWIHGVSEKEIESGILQDEEKDKLVVKDKMKDKVPLKMTDKKARPAPATIKNDEQKKIAELHKRNVQIHRIESSLEAKILGKDEALKKHGFTISEIRESRRLDKEKKEQAAKRKDGAIIYHAKKIFDTKPKSNYSKSPTVDEIIKRQEERVARLKKK